MFLTQAIFARRAVRSYTSQEVDEPTLTTLLRAAVQAPSAMNRQPWLSAVVQDEAQLKRYSDRAKMMLLAQADGDPKSAHYASMLTDPSFNIFYNATTLVVIGVAERGRYSDADGWLAAQNLMSPPAPRVSARVASASRFRFSTCLRTVLSGVPPVARAETGG
jgi:nitroreductase